MYIILNLLLINFRQSFTVCKYNVIQTRLIVYGRNKKRSDGRLDILVLSLEFKECCV
jgi:hypothetical protein